jgi:hypothetical protein
VTVVRILGCMLMASHEPRLVLLLRTTIDLLFKWFWPQGRDMTGSRSFQILYSVAEATAILSKPEPLLGGADDSGRRARHGVEPIGLRV